MPAKPRFEPLVPRRPIKQIWVRKFEQSLNNRLYTNAYQRALASGISEEELRWTLYEYTKPNPLHHPDLRNARKQIRTEGFQELDSTIHRLELFLKKYVAQHLHYPVLTMHFFAGSEKPLERPVARLLVALKREREWFKRETSFRSKDRQEDLIVGLVLQMENSDGRPAYSDVAHLLTGAISAHDRPKTMQPAAVKKIVKRFEKQHPAEYHTLRTLRNSLGPEDYDSYEG